MSTKIFIQRDGIVNHSHAGVKGWHNPATKHADAALHVTEKVQAPENESDLNTPELVKQYAEALAGKSFYELYTKALQDRRDEGAPGTGPRSKAEQYGEDGQVLVKTA